MIIAVDFDGTIVTDRFPEVGEPMMFAIESLIKLKENGNKLILWTCREDNKVHNYLTEAIDFCRKQGLEFDAINSNVFDSPFNHLGPGRKVYADWYIDDKALQPRWDAYFG